MNSSDNCVARRKDVRHHTINVPNEEVIELTLYYDIDYRTIVLMAGESLGCDISIAIVDKTKEKLH